MWINDTKKCQNFIKNVSIFFIRFPIYLLVFTNTLFHILFVKKKKTFWFYNIVIIYQLPTEKFEIDYYLLQIGYI